MSFKEGNFSPLGGQARAGNSPALWSFESDTDTLADVQAPDYFNEIATRVEAGDFINVSLADGKSIITVESVDRTAREVVIDSDTVGGGATAETEFFLNTNVRFFGEVGKPSENNPAWDETGGGQITLENQDVFGINRQVIKFDDTIPTLVTASFSLTAQNWADINSFGASYSGTLRLDTTNDGGVNVLLQDDVPDKRYGLDVRRSGDFLRLIGKDGSPFTQIMDGLEGRPRVLFDEFFKVEIVVPPGLGLAEVFVNDVKLSQTIDFRTNTGGSGTAVLVTSGSSAATNRTSYFSDYGVTIYEESPTKTISTKSMEADGFTVFIPPGKRDYQLNFPPGITRDIGDRFSFLAQNVGGEVTLTSDPLDPLILFSGLKTLLLSIKAVSDIKFENTIADANNYELDQPAGAKSFQIDGQLLKPGDISYNLADDVFEGKRRDGGVLQFGEEGLIRVVNKTVATIPDGSAVRVDGYDAATDSLTVVLALANSTLNAQVLGVTTGELRVDEVGKVANFGRVNDLDTSSFSAGDQLFLSETVPGGFVNVLPGNNICLIGNVTNSDALTGSINVEIQPPTLEPFLLANDSVLTGNTSIQNLAMGTRNLILSSAIGLTASTNQTQGQGPLTAALNEVSIVANDNDVRTMGPAVRGLTGIAVSNNGANILQLFPAAGDDLGAGVNLSVKLAPENHIVFSCFKAGLWRHTPVNVHAVYKRTASVIFANDGTFQQLNFPVTFKELNIGLDGPEEEVIFQQPGTYVLEFGYQLLKDGGNSLDTLATKLELDLGAGFAEIPDSRWKTGIKNTNYDLHISRTNIVVVKAGDRARYFAKVGETTEVFFFSNADIPAYVLNIFKIHD